MSGRRTRDWRAREFHTTVAVVLEVRPGRRGERWVWFWTRDRGVLTCSAAGARRPRKTWGGLLVPLTRGRLTYKIPKDDRGWSYLISLDNVWSPAVHRSVTPEYLVFLSFCSEVARTFLTPETAEPDLFDVLCAVARASVKRRPLRGLAVAWLWRVLRAHGFLGVRADCPGCGRGVDAARELGVWDLQGNLWHPGCREEKGAQDFLLEPALGNLLDLGDDPTGTRRFLAQAETLAKSTAFFRFLLGRGREISGRPWRTLEAARTLTAADPL